MISIISPPDSPSPPDINNDLAIINMAELELVKDFIDPPAINNMLQVNNLQSLELRCNKMGNILHKHAILTEASKIAMAALPNGGGLS